MRNKNIRGFSIDKVASRAGNDPDVLRMENLDTDLPPPESAVVATQLAVGRDEDNSYLPFTGKMHFAPDHSQTGQHVYRCELH
ncbi:MAG: hypothetical protein R2784_19180 [Saprospiraceae bacterium]